MELQAIELVLNGIIKLSQSDTEFVPVPIFPEQSPSELLDNPKSVDMMSMQMLQMLSNYQALFSSLPGDKERSREFILTPAVLSGIPSHTFLHRSFVYERGPDERAAFNSRNAQTLKLIQSFGRKSKSIVNSDLIFI